MNQEDSQNIVQNQSESTPSSQIVTVPYQEDNPSQDEPTIPKIQTEQQIEIDTVHNIHVTSFLLLVLIGTLFFLCGLMAQNQIALPASLLAYKVTRLPFLILAVVYISSGILEDLASDKKKHTILVALTIGVSICALIGGAAAHFLLK